MRFRRRFSHDFYPVGELEAQLVDVLADDLWRLARLRRVEAGLFAANMLEQQEADLWEDLKAMGGRPSNKNPAPTNPREAAFAKIRTIRSQLREPKSLLGRAYGRDVGGSGAFERLSRYEGTIRTRMDRTLTQLEKLQVERLAAAAAAAEAPEAK